MDRHQKSKAWDYTPKGRRNQEQNCLYSRLLPSSWSPWDLDSRTHLSLSLKIYSPFLLEQVCNGSLLLASERILTEMITNSEVNLWSFISSPFIFPWCNRVNPSEDYKPSQGRAKWEYSRFKIGPGWMPAVSTSYVWMLSIAYKIYNCLLYALKKFGLRSSKECCQ